MPIQSNIPSVLELPAVGSGKQVPIVVLVTNSSGVPVNFDGAVDPTLSIVDDSSNDYSYLVASFLNTDVGRYESAYTNADSQPIAVLSWEVSGPVGGATHRHVAATQLTANQRIASSLAGPSSVTLDFRDGSSAEIPNVSFRVWNSLLTVLIGFGTANGSGIGAFGLPNGSYKVVANPASGVLFPTSTLTVSGTTGLVITGTATSLPASSDPTTCAAYLDCYTRNGAAQSGVTLHYRLIVSPSGTATTYDTSPSETPASDSSGRLAVTVLRNATYQFWRGNGPKQRVVVGDVATLALPQILSSGST